ncbi:MAG: pentapeptide repeat-containing protein [Hydrococcus sp. Prado102]|jgi:tetratricopeptide (TPR) repeat protein|nr:pentapeptide repeat-containing protein [Hydrococcus sp. Prado102]
MKPSLLAIATILSTISLSIPVRAENLAHIRQLLSTKECSQCELSGAGLVMSNLAGARLSGANLSQANLSQANLSGADLSGANLTGASLFGANLTGANLSGAILDNTDLRSAYLTNANLIGTKLDTAFVQGSFGMPNYAGTPQQFFNWGLIESQKGNHGAAIEYYNQALNIEPAFAPAYLARGIANYRLGERDKAQKDAEVATTLFQQQQNQAGYQASANFLTNMEIIRQANRDPEQTSEFNNFLQGAASLALQLMMFF